MIKSIIVIGRKYLSDFVAYSNYWITEIRLLTAIFKKALKRKTVASEILKGNFALYGLLVFIVY